MSSPSSLGVVILAAGASKRLGRPKQLLTYHNTTLLQHTIDSANSLEALAKLIILGAQAEKIAIQIDTKSFEVVINEHWANGLSSSIEAGLTILRKNHPTIKNVLFVLSDQPYLTHDHLKKLLSKHQDDEPCITGSFYANQVGVPIVFSYHYFDELLTLDGDQGARKIVAKYPYSIQSVPFEKGEIDVDTEEDYQNLIEP